jgi:hypothetical protein
MKSLRLVFILVLFLSILSINTVFAQTIPDNGTDPVDVPVDLAIGLLASGAALLGYKKK